MKVKKEVAFHKDKKQPTRKQLRKEQRKQKKQRKLDYYTHRRKPGRYVLINKADNEENVEHVSFQIKNHSSGGSETTEQLRRKEIKEKSKLQSQMNKQRKKQLIEENLKEDQVIRSLEKQLKFNKRKSKAIPKSFREDGLDYLLEVCDPEMKKCAIIAEKQLTEVNEEFQQDLELMTTTPQQKNITKSEVECSDESSEISANEQFDEPVDVEEEEEIVSDVSESDEEIIAGENIEETCNSKNELQQSDSDNQNGENNLFQKNVCGNKRKRVTDASSDEISLSSDGDSSQEDDKCGVSDKTEHNEKEKEEGIWEDIYGRKRRKDGTVIEPTHSKYVPPAVRANNETVGLQQTEKLVRLKRILKGLLNRLAESNIHSIASQMENLYMNNSRNDMNETLTNLILASLVSPVNTPERLLLEHVLLIIVLHANVGSEVGAHFLQTVVNKFDSFVKEEHPVENKMLDNVVKILSQLYNFKLFDSKLLYEVLDIFSAKFEEKDVECILHILRSVGFTLRKDNPLALKDMILNLQKRASNVSEENKDNSRVKFMLDTLLAVKNNNVSKITNYDSTHSEHLKKILKGLIRKGNYVTQLNISLEDLLKADERGKWWVVGSAWTGNATGNKNVKDIKPESFSQNLLELAKKQRMNTDSRRTIFCIIMSAEDYLDAYERLLRLGLKNQQEKEIINIILHCSLHEKIYNPYYAFLAQKFCEYDRKYQMITKYSIWDKLKALNDHPPTQLSNLAKLLTHLFIKKALSISVLKIIQFSELDKITMRFMRQILLGILLHKDSEDIHGIFEKVAVSEKLKMFKESIHLFICHFLLKNVKEDNMSDQQQKTLLENAKLVKKLLTTKAQKTYF